MKTVHEPVLLREVIQYLQPKINQNFVDCTVGGGGHAEAILNLIGPNGSLLGLDWDAGAIERSKARLAAFGERVILVNSNYQKFSEIVAENHFENISGALLDLGLSSDQLQVSGRGFSFQGSEPLDMRYDLESPLTARTVVNTWREDELVKIFSEYGEERASKTIARMIIAARREAPIETTDQLVNLILKFKRFEPKKSHPATQIFQALRMAVNHELDNVEQGIKNIIATLPVGARLAVISFHSIEDRLVKTIFKDMARSCVCPPEFPVCRCDHEAEIKILNTKPIVPSAEEVSQNPKSRSAKLRVVEKV